MSVICDHGKLWLWYCFFLHFIFLFDRPKSVQLSAAIQHNVSATSMKTEVSQLPLRCSSESVQPCHRTIIDCKTESVLLLSCYHGSRWWTSKRRQWVIKRCENISCSHCCSQGNRLCRHLIWARIYFFSNTGFSSGSQSPDTFLLGSPLASEKLIRPCVCLKFARQKNSSNQNWSLLVL